jgi:hypothetical protein
MRKTITRSGIANWLRIDESNIPYLMKKCTVKMPGPIRKEGKNYIYDYTEIEEWVMTGPTSFVKTYSGKSVCSSLNRVHVNAFLTGLFDSLESRLKHHEKRVIASNTSPKTTRIRVNQEI